MEFIQFDKFTLQNGLDVILHEDPSSPIVGVNVWYHVGSKDEIPGKTGYAHLFEHIMFEGSKNHNHGYFEPLQQVGGNLNGSTTMDRTNYWETIPSNYLELALWLESDRMGYLLDALDQRRFDVQKDVVKNERRQSYENRPYGLASLRLQEVTYPAPHPYNWPTIGFHQDLDVATLDDAREFFQRFYSPSNASLAIAGDIKIGPTKELVERYFSELIPGPAVPRARRTDSNLQGQIELTLYDKVLLPRCYLVWPTVPRFHPDEAPLSLLADILGDGKSARLYQSLVYEKRIAQSVNAHNGGAEIAGDFELEVTASHGHAITEVEKVVRQEIERLKSKPPTNAEMSRAKNRIEWRHVLKLASVGGFGGRADQLNAFNVFQGDPNLINEDLNRYLAVEADDVYRVANSYLGSRHVKLFVLPEPVRKAEMSSIDRTVQPQASISHPFFAPVPERDRLPNGVDILVVEKRGLPSVAFGLAFKNGASSDPEHLPGLLSFTTSMLQEGTSSKNSRVIAEEFESVGGQLASMTGREGTILATEVLTRHWPKILELMADLVRNPIFPEAELERIRTERITALQRVSDDANALASRLTPMLLFGADSPYGHPVTGHQDSVKSFSRDDLVTCFDQSFHPNNTTLIVVGDVCAEEVRKVALKALGGWEPHGIAISPENKAPIYKNPSSSVIYLLDKPGAPQSVIRAGFVGVPRDDSDYLALSILNYLFGGQFTARLNLNLRQDKGFSYGYRSWIEWHRLSSALIAGGGVQTSVTAEALQETLDEFAGIQGKRPVSQPEFDSAKAGLLRQFPSSFETSWQVLDQIADLIFDECPDDYYLSLPEKVDSLDLSKIQTVAGSHIKCNELTIAVVGDRNSIEPGLKKLGLPVQIVDQNGFPLVQ